VVNLKEGNSFTNLLQLIKDQGYNKDTGIMIGSIKSTSPFRIRLGELTLDSDDFMMSQTIKYMLDGTLPYTDDKLKNEDRVIVLVDGDNFYIIDRVVS
jgi:hypothetical protein